MNWLNQIFHRRSLYNDLSEEMRQHLEEKTEQLQREGLSRKEAEQAARRAFGNATLIEQRSRETWQWPVTESLWADLRYALRQLRKAPGFAITAILVLALGIGANATVFSLLRAVVFPSLPVPHPQQIFRLQAVSSPNDAQWLFSQSAFERLGAATAIAAPVAAHSGIAKCFASIGHSSGEVAQMQLVSTNFFSVLEIQPERGRFFTDTDILPAGGAWPVVLRYGYWQRRFASDNSILGQTILLNSKPVVIVGIAPQHFLGVSSGNAPDFWLPLGAQSDVHYFQQFDTLGYGSGVNFDAPFRQQQGFFWLWLLARAPSQQQERAIAAWTNTFQPDLRLIARFSPRPNNIMAAHFRLRPAAVAESTLRESYAEPLFALMAMVGAVLLIACINLANLQGTRLVARQRELAIRASLGASRARILRQLLMENMLLALAGGALSFVIADVAGPAILRWSSAQPVPLELRFDLRFILFALALLLFAVFLFGFLPALKLTRSDLSMAARGISTASLTPYPQRRFDGLMLVVQVALSLLLVSLAGMFARTLVNIYRIHSGMDREHILSVHVDFPGAGYSTSRLRATYPQLVELVQALPGVRSAALDMCRIPNCGWNSVIHVAGRTGLSQEQMTVGQDNVGSGYFPTLGIPVLRGREFDDNDRSGTQHVAVINQAAAKKLFGDEDPLGHRVGFGPPPSDSAFLIVGEVADSRVNNLTDDPPPMFYLPVSQEFGPIDGLEVRTAGDPRQMANEVRKTLLALDPQMPIVRIDTLNAEYDDTLMAQHLLVRLAAAFALLALALAAIGFYGVLSFRVARRTSEFGVRMALGATRGNILRQVLSNAARILAAGIAIGAALALLAAHALQSLLYESGAFDWLSLFAAAVVLTLIGFAAAYIPAIRAASIDPMQALRAE